MLPPQPCVGQSNVKYGTPCPWSLLGLPREGHPALAEAAVCAYHDAILGEKICVCIVPADGETPSLEDICAFLMQCGVAKFKLPERLVVTEALPRNPLGKVLRHKLAEWADEEKGGA